MRTGSRTTASDRRGGEPPEGPFRRWLALAVVALGALGLIVGARRLWPSRPPAPTAAAEGTVRAKGPRVLAALPPAAPRVNTAPLASASAPEPLPPSLQDTDEDGALRVDARGDLIVGPDILSFFDYYLSATGEESPAAIRARIVAAIRKKLTGSAADRAEKLLDRYLAFREATRSLSGGDGADLTARLEDLRRLRRESFGADDAQKLFGEQERVDAVAVAAQKIQTDPALSPEERSRRVAELEEQLPEAVRAARQAASRPLRQQQEEQAMRAAGATDAEIQRRRVETVGEDGAARLKALDEQRAAWKERLRTFQAEREAIGRAQPDPAARQAAVEKLLEASFSPEERLRVKAIDGRAAQAAP